MTRCYIEAQEESPENYEKTHHFTNVEQEYLSIYIHQLGHYERDIDVNHPIESRIHKKSTEVVLWENCYWYVVEKKFRHSKRLCSLLIVHSKMPHYLSDRLLRCWKSLYNKAENK